MKSKPTTWMMVLLVVLASLATTRANATTSGTTAIRVEAASAAKLDSSGVASTTDINYGSFRWLVLDDLQLDKLTASGVKYTIVNDAGLVQVMDYRFDPLEDG